jgi:hypothetical protein
VKPKPPDSQTAPAIKFKVNVIVPVADAPGGSLFFSAGEPSPYRSLDEVPPNLQPFVVTDDDEPEAEIEGRANYELSVVYQMTEGGRRGRAISRQVTELERSAENQAWAEEQLSIPLRPEIADALEDQNAQRVGRQMAEAEARARWRDAASEAAQGGEL